MAKLEAYFWANLDGKVLNVEVAYCRVFRKGCEVGNAWAEALLAGAFDEIEIQFRNCPSADAILQASSGGCTRRVNPRIFNEAFLSVVYGARGSRRIVKYRLENVSLSEFYALNSDSSVTPGHFVGSHPPQSDPGDTHYSVFVDFTKIEEVAEPSLEHAS
jgi:hypothetical protein